MANSSDWLGALSAPETADPEAAAPGWLALLGAGGGFREASPFGEPEAAAPTPPPPPAPPPEEPASDPQADAIAQAYATGEAAGRAAAEADAAARTARQRALRLNFRALDEAALAVLAEDLAATVMALCDGVLGEAARDRDGLVARCREAARRIGGAADSLALHLNPDDIALLGEDALAGCRLVPDPALEAGSVTVEGPEGSISDGPAEWRRAIAAAVRG